jgi:acetyltransferase EpsM
MNIVIFGSGGHAGVVLEAIRACNVKLRESANSNSFLIVDVVGLVDETISDRCHKHDHPVRQSYEEFEFSNPDSWFAAIGDNSIRSRIADKTPRKSVTVIHPTAAIADRSSISEGVFVGPKAVLGNGAAIDKFSILNSGAILEHDSRLGKFSHLCPGVVAGGWVTIGDYTTIGLNASVHDGIRIGNNCVIGMGSVVLKDIPDGSIAWGNPCRLQSQKVRPPEKRYNPAE